MKHQTEMRVCSGSDKCHQEQHSSDYDGTREGTERRCCIIARVSVHLPVIVTVLVQAPGCNVPNQQTLHLPYSLLSQIVTLNSWT